MSEDANTNPAALHLVVSADPLALRRCFRRCAPGDSVLLLCEGVLHLSDPEMPRGLTAGVELLCAREDLQARGLPVGLADGLCRVVDDRAFAGLLERHLHCLTWK